MIYRHLSAPARSFTQFSHELIRHPRLSSDAVRLLTWQLSLPQGARECLSRTAERARIGSTAFTRAKRQLKDEGFVHERRVQAPGGLWVTQQLVSSVPLSPGEAVKILAGTPVRTSAERVSSQVAPSPPIPAVGERTDPSTDGHPEKQPAEDTSNPPPEPVAPEAPPTESIDANPDGTFGGTPDANPDGTSGANPGANPDATPDTTSDGTPDATPDATPDTTSGGTPDGTPDTTADRTPDTTPDANPDTTPHGRREEARALVGALPLLSPALRHIPPAMRDELTTLAARWLDAGHTSAEVHEHILRGLPGAGTPVHRPGGLVRYLLREVAPRPHAAGPAGPWPQVSARLAGTRECTGSHDQATLFRPVGDETRCPTCEPVAVSAG